MKKFCAITIKLTASAIIITGSFLTLVAHYGDNQWDPIQAIQQLKNQHRRDDAIDLVNFLKDNQSYNGDELSGLGKDVPYCILERATAFV